MGSSGTFYVKTCPYMSIHEVFCFIYFWLNVGVWRAGIALAAHIYMLIQDL